MTEFTGAFASCANDTNETERDAMTRVLLSALLSKNSAKVEYPQGNPNIGTEYWTALTAADIENTELALPQAEIVAHYREDNTLRVLKIDLRPRSTTCGFVTSDDYKTILPVSIAFEEFMDKPKAEQSLQSGKAYNLLMHLNSY